MGNTEEWKPRPKKSMQNIGILFMLIAFLAIVGVFLYLVVSTHEVVVNGVVITMENPYVETLILLITGVFFYSAKFLFPVKERTI